MKVEWLAVSGFGFHGSKLSLLYYGQPLTTTGMQRFASRYSLYESDARSFRARIAIVRSAMRIFPSARLTPANLRVRRDKFTGSHPSDGIAVTAAKLCTRDGGNEGAVKKASSPSPLPECAGLKVKTRYRRSLLPARKKRQTDPAE